MKKKGKIILILIAVLLLIIVGIMIYLNQIAIPKEPQEDISQEENIDQSQEDAKERQRLSQMQEGDRIKTYVGKYIKLIEKKDYQGAYNLLYEPFKQNYFPTLEEYTNYIESCHFSEMLAVDYDNIRTRGKYYIVTIGIGSLLDSSTRKVETTIVLKEDNYNDFKLSFKKILDK